MEPSDPPFPRAALVERLARADHRAIVSAPPGFGKTTLLEAWAVHRRALVVSLANVAPREAAAVALEVAEAGLSRPSKPLRAPRIAFDDVAPEAVARVVTAVPANVGVVVATRGAVIERAPFRDVLDMRALAFRGDELAREVGVVRAREILALTGGWPQLVGALRVGEPLADAAARALASVGPEVQRHIGRLATIGTVRRAVLQFVAPEALSALSQLVRCQFATIGGEDEGGTVQIMGDVLGAGRALLEERWASAEPRAYRELQRRVAELLAAGARLQPVELVERFARAGDAGRVAELLLRYGPLIDVELTRERRSATLIDWTELAAQGGAVTPPVYVLRALARARSGLGIDAAAGARSESERAQLGWRWRSRWAEAAAYAAWDRGSVAEAARHFARARGELIGVRVDDPDANALEVRWRLGEARCVRLLGPWPRARGVLLDALDAATEPKGSEARALRALLAASALGEGDAKVLARVAQGGDQVAKIADAWGELLLSGDVAAARARLEGAPFEPWAHVLAQLARRRLGGAIEREVAPTDHEDPRGDLVRELAEPRGDSGRWDAVAEAIRGLGGAHAEAPDASTLAAIARAASAGGFAAPWGLAPAGVLEGIEALGREHMGDAPWALRTRAGPQPLTAAGYAEYAEGKGPETVVVVVPEERIFVAGARLEVGQKRVLVPLLTALLTHAEGPLSLRELAAAVWRVRSARLAPAVQTKIKVAVSRLRTLLGREHEIVVTTKKPEGGALVPAYQLAPEVTFAVVMARS